MLQSPKSLVTGAAGFIGSHVVDELIAAGHSVVALDDLSGGFQKNVNPNAKFLQGSILDQDLLNSLFEESRFDYVFHLAAYAAEGLSHFIRHFNYQNNLVGSINLINLSVRYEIKCFVFTSSIAVYGKNQLPMTEITTPLPEDPYGVAKYAVELDLLAAHEMFGLNSIVFRPHNVYGERQNIADRYRNVVGIFMNNILQSKALPVFGDGLQTRAFSYIGDVAPLIARSIEVQQAWNETFNVGSDHPYTVNELAKAVLEAMQADLPIEYLEARSEVVHAYASHEKMTRFFGTQTETSLQEGLSRMATWVKSTGHRPCGKFGAIEIKKNLPPSWNV
jgi:UDP-glucose 4-epimerase